MLIEVFGPGCARCQTLEKNAHQALEQFGGDHRVVKVSDYAAMAARGIRQGAPTPASRRAAADPDRPDRSATERDSSRNGAVRP